MLVSLVSLVSLESHVSIESQGPTIRQWVKAAGLEVHLKKHLQKTTHPALTSVSPSMGSSSSSKNSEKQDNEPKEKQEEKRQGGGRSRLISQETEALIATWTTFLKSLKGEARCMTTYCCVCDMIITYIPLYCDACV